MGTDLAHLLGKPVLGKREFCFVLKKNNTSHHVLAASPSLASVVRTSALAWQDLLHRPSSHTMAGGLTSS